MSSEKNSQMGAKGTGLLGRKIKREIQPGKANGSGKSHDHQQVSEGRKEQEEELELVQGSLARRNGVKLKGENRLDFRQNSTD